MTTLAYSVTEAAKAAGVSATVIRRALRSTDPRSFPPPLKAKRIGTGPSAKQLVLAAELERWLLSLPDA